MGACGWKRLEGGGYPKTPMNELGYIRAKLNELKVWAQIIGDNPLPE